ncbi:MAG TPA: hypothetical protein PLD77_01560 [Candidatus Dojkabacteria bacterium]|nr:hypothetical protein [Candidatus Dojkabacteria bacterium]
MFKINIPKINLSKKQILLICIPLAILILLVMTFFILKSMGKIDIENEVTSNQTENGYADDSDAVLEMPLQAYTPADTETKYMVYADIIKTDPEVEMIESCTYSDGTEAKETKYYVGREPVQVSNHCLLTFAEYDGPNALEETYPYNVYLALPDGSLITIYTKETPSMQVNMYEKETRIVQLNGYAYYRVAPQENGKKFSVQMVDRVMYVTGTEFFAGVSSSFSGDGIWGHVELYEGSAEVRLRTQDLIVMMTNKDYANYGHWKENGSWAWYWDEANAGKIHTFYSNDNTTKTETLEFAGNGDKITWGYMDKVTDFLNAQVETTMATYGFGNYKTVANSLEAYIDEKIVTEKELRQEMVIKETFAYAKAYENYQKWYDGLVEKGEELRAKAAAEAAASVSTGTAYSVCPKGTAYAGNGKCCPAGTYLNTKGYCQGDSSTSGNTATTYNPSTPSVSSSSGSSSSGSGSSGSGSNCVSSGTVAYQACKMAAEGVTNNGQYTLSGNQCCMPDVAEPTLEPVN